MYTSMCKVIYMALFVRHGFIVMNGYIKDKGGKIIIQIDEMVHSLF